MDEQRRRVEASELANHDHGIYPVRKQQVVVLNAEVLSELRIIIREEFRDAIQEFQDRRGAAAE